MILQRLKNLYFLSGISKEDIKANPRSFALHHANKTDMQDRAYIAGFSDEESTFMANLPLDKQVEIS